MRSETVGREAGRRGALRVSELSKGERLFLQRIRQGLTQEQAADQMGVKPHLYKLWEQDRGKHAPKIKIDRLAPHERMRIYRRRSGLSMVDLEFRVGCTRYWIWKMETGRAPVTRLQMYWEKETPNGHEPEDED